MRWSFVFCVLPLLFLVSSLYAYSVTMSFSCSDSYYSNSQCANNYGWGSFMEYNVTNNVVSIIGCSGKRTSRAFPAGVFINNIRFTNFSVSATFSGGGSVSCSASASGCTGYWSGCCEANCPSGGGVVSNNAFGTLSFDVFVPDSTCDISQIATIDSAFYTGTHSNPPRYELFKLPPNCPKTVVPVSSLPNSSSPVIDGNNQLNVAVSLDQNGNYVSEGWDNNHTQAIFVSAEQTQEQLGCESSDPDGYFVFCTEFVDTDPPPTHTECSGLPCPGGGGGGGLPPGRPPDVVTPFNPNPGGGGGGGSSSSNGGIADLTKWEDMLKRVIPIPPNPIPLLREIRDKLFNFYDGVMEWIEPQDDPEYEDIDDYEFDEFDEIDIDLDTLDLDTLDIDTKWLDSLFPKQDSDKEVDSLIREEKKKMDSLKKDSDSLQKGLDTVPDFFKKELENRKIDPDSTVNKTKEKVLETFKDMADKIKEAVAKGLKPIENVLPKGDGDCTCLEASFKGLSFGIIKGNISVSSMMDTKIICEHIGTIRRIIMVIVAITSIGMILATLRR